MLKYFIFMSFFVGVSLLAAPEKIADGVYVEEMEDPTTKDPLYFVMEEVSVPVPEGMWNERKDFWEEYIKADEKVLHETHGKLVDEKLVPGLDSGLRKNLTVGYYSFKKFFKPFISNNFNDIRTPHNDFWVAYVSPQKPTGPAYKQGKEFPIEMAMGVLTHKGSPIVTHLGINRNYQYLNDVLKKKQKKHKNLANQLHAYVAQVMRMLDGRKIYMITAPAGKMAEILQKNPILKGKAWTGVQKKPLVFESPAIQKEWQRLNGRLASVKQEIRLLEEKKEDRKEEHYTEAGEELRQSLEKSKEAYVKKRLAEQEANLAKKSKQAPSSASKKKKRRRPPKDRSYYEQAFEDEHAREYSRLKGQIVEKDGAFSKKENRGFSELQRLLRKLRKGKKVFLEKHIKAKLKAPKKGQRAKLSPILKDEKRERIIVSPDQTHLLFYVSAEAPGQEYVIADGKVYEGIDNWNDFSYPSKTAGNGRAGRKSGALQHSLGHPLVAVDYKALGRSWKSGTK